MNVIRISDRVHYIGVNDRTTQRFEAMWPLPYGVSYNSYLVSGSEKMAIIDGVEVSNALKLIDHVNEIGGGRKPSYLIINHMEPDHSGAIRILRAVFPDITIVGNAQTIAMVRGYYDIDDNVLTVKDGDTLQLGGDTTLRFTLTPMVHWPETMMTYLEEEKILFSGDAFGCFGALNGAIIDEDMDTDRYFPEMVRYYSNIVGKYGVPVQRALKKFADVSIGTVCPTHGPVWRKRLAEVVGLYNSLSLYEPLDNGVTIVYGSMYGNTQGLVEVAAETLAETGVRDIAVHNASVSDLSYILADVFRHRGLVIASPTYSNTLFPPMRSVMEAITNREIKNREIMMIGSSTWSQQAIKVMSDYLGTLKAGCVTDPVDLKHAPAQSDIERCREAAATLGRILTGKAE